MKFRILHLSDLHFGRECPLLFHTPMDQGTEAASILFRDLEESGFFPGIDAVVISGDISFYNEVDEFAAGRHFIQALSRATKLPLSDFMLIPGNHDIRWSKPASTGVGPKYLYLTRPEAEYEYRKFYSELCGTAPSEYLSRVKVFPDARVAIVGLNSCRLYREESAGLGYVGRDQIFFAISDLRKLPSYNDSRNEFIKIAVLHHHLVPISDLQVFEQPSKAPADRRFSLTLDASEVLEYLLRDNFALVLHGHQHVPFCAVESRIPVTLNPIVQRRSQIGILAAGTFGVGEKHCDLNHLYNHFQVIDIGDSSIQIIGFQAAHRAEPKYEVVTRAALQRRSLTRPLTQLELPKLSSIEKDVHVRIEEESAIVGRLVVSDLKIKEQVFDYVSKYYKAYPTLKDKEPAEIRAVFEEVLQIWIKDDDRESLFKHFMRTRGVTFGDFILDLIQAYVLFRTS